MTEAWFNFRDIDISTLEQYVREIKDEYLSTLEQIVNQNQSKRTFENTVQPLINVETQTEARQKILNYVQNFYVDPALRDRSTELLADLSKFLIDCSLRTDVYQAFIEYESDTYQTEQFHLTHEENRYISRQMVEFKRNGLHLPNDQLENLRTMRSELSDLQIGFEKNINDENTSFEFLKTQLDGLPSFWFTPERSVGNCLYKVTLKYPDYFPVMEYVKSEDVRKTLYIAFNSRCAQENGPLLERAVKLRYFIAKTLGYETHGDYVTEVKLVKTAKTAIDFQNQMNDYISPVYRQDMINLLQFAKRYPGNPLNKYKFDPWDLPYYIRAYQEAVCDFDKDNLRQYFPLHVVRNGLFKIYQTLLGVTFQEIVTTNKWHEDVLLFSVTDTASNVLLGYFYLDMFPREGKFSHAAAFDFVSSCDLDKITGEETRRPCIITMACNFEQNGCISFDDVETFFHEFGHVMHQICSTPQLQEFCGFNVEWDFIEALSQNLEHWCYYEESLKLMSSHSVTGECIPDDYVRKLRLCKKVLSSHLYKRMVLLGTYDMTIHTMKFISLDDTSFDSQQAYYDVMKKIIDTNCISTNGPLIHLPANFSHIMDSYDAGYYGYLLTDTYAANMFYKMFRDGHILDPVVGMHYRKTMLEPGSTKDGFVLLQDFLESQPDVKYFLVDRGFIEECADIEDNDLVENLPVSDDWKKAVSTGMSMRDFQSKYAAELADYNN